MRLIGTYFSRVILQDFHKRFLFGKYAATLFQHDYFAFHNEKWTMCARPRVRDTRVSKDRH